MEPFASAPGSCPPGLGAGAIVPLTGLWWHGRFCAVGLPVFRVGTCLSQVTASKWRADTETRPAGPEVRSTPGQMEAQGPWCRLQA